MPGIDAGQPSDEKRGERDWFATTQWSIVLAAAQHDNTPAARAALETLCRAYWFPLFAYVRRRGYDQNDAQDLVQGFFALILSRQDLQAVRKERGRFRSYLLAALKNFLVNEWKHAAAEKRGGGQIPIPLDDLIAAHAGGPASTDARTPDRAFDQQWAIALLEHVLATLRDELRAEGKEKLFEELRGFLVGEPDTRPQAEIAAQLGMTENAVKQIVFRLRQRYQKLLRTEVANTVSTLGDVEEELRDLIAALRN